MKTVNIFIAICFVLSLGSCKKEEAPADSTNTEKTTLNVSYGNDPLQNMDIYLPEGRSSTNTKVIILIHGGAWAAGDKTDFDRFNTSFKTRFPGFAIFNINYRLSAAPANLFPTQELDVKAALEFIYSKAAEYGISDKYVLIGASAGAHLAMLQGYKYTSPLKPKAIISLSGPTDLNDMYNNPAGGNPLLSLLLVSAIGKSPVEDPLIYTSSSPVNFINSSSPPTLLLHGDMDPLVNYSQAVLAKNKLQAAGVANEYVLYQGSAHVDTWNDDVFADCFIRMQAFVTAHVL